jgi:hypothetical protein
VGAQRSLAHSYRHEDSGRAKAAQRHKSCEGTTGAALWTRPEAQKRCARAHLHKSCRACSARRSCCQTCRNAAAQGRSKKHGRHSRVDRRRVIAVDCASSRP